MAGVRLVRRAPYELVPDVDVTVQPIEAIVARLISLGGVADVTIEDPPLEQIIATLYRAQHGGLSERVQSRTDS
jgi:ABC-type uncharacterized transport system ATPase subunit